jgi:hypothetical protein
LLDVELEIGADAVDAASLRQVLEVEAGTSHCVRDTATPPILEVELPAERAAAQHPGLETAALLVVEGHDPERPRRLDPVGLQRTNDRKRGQNPQRPVVAAPARDRVEMGPDEHRFPFAGLPAAEHVSRRIDLTLQAEMLEPPQEPGVRLGELRAPGETGNTAAVRADERGALELSRERGHRASSASDRARPRP